MIASSPENGSSRTISRGLVDDGAEQLDGLRHALGQGADRLSRPFAEAVLGEQFVGAAAPFGERQAAQRAHEGDRLARGHRRVEAALLGQIADRVRRLDRAVVAEHAAAARRRVDDPEQHAQGGGLAGAVGAEQAVDRAGRDREADPVDRAGVAEILDQVDRLDRGTVVNPFVLSLSKHCFSYEIQGQPFDKLRANGVVEARG